MTQDEKKVDTETSGQDQQPQTAPFVEIVPLRSSPDIKDLAAALAVAQGLMKHPLKNKTAKVPMKAGGTYSYNYADLADVLDSIRGPFAANGLSLLQIPYAKAHGIGLVSRIMHSSGQWIEGTLEMFTENDKPQTIGSAITYARRYMASPMCGVASDEDDDGSMAQDNGGQTGARDRGHPQVSRDGDDPLWKKALASFIPFGLTKEHLETFRNGATMERFDAKDFDALRELAGALKDGSVKPEQIKAIPKAPPAATGTPSARKDKLDSAFGSPKK